MLRILISAALVMSLSFPAYGWNNKGHMVVADLVWLKMNVEQRAAVTKILLAHPHYREFLAAEPPSDIPEDEWVFLRAATWPDWVRDHYATDFSHAKWHFIDLPYVPPGSHLNPKDYPPETPNVVTQIPVCLEKMRNGNAEEKAIYLSWLLHLVGDIHQPLHCTTLFSEHFPTGDRGGNLALVRFGTGHPSPLHPFWDGLLGKAITTSSIRTTVREVQDCAQQEQDTIDPELKKNLTPASWAEEGLANAKKYAYLDGALKLANSDDHPNDDDVPTAPADYPKACGHVARLCAAKAASRLLTVLDEILK